MEIPDKVRENRMRRWARRLGLELCKSRARLWNVNNQGQYQVVDTWSNTIIAGADYDWSLDEVESFLAETERKQKHSDADSQAAT